jgi:hypothetical protein
MKLRIKGSSVRLRVLRPEVSRLIETESIEERVYFTPSDQSAFTYACRSQHGFTASHSEAGIRSGAFSGFDHGGATLASASRWRSSFGGGSHGGGVEVVRRSYS